MESTLLDVIYSLYTYGSASVLREIFLYLQKYLAIHSDYVMPNSKYTIYRLS